MHIPHVNFLQSAAQQQQSRHSSSNNQAYSFINEGVRDHNISHFHIRPSSKSMIEENINKKYLLPMDEINDSNKATLNLKKLYKFYDDPNVLSNNLLVNNNRSNNKQNKNNVNDVSHNYQSKNNANYLQVEGHSQSVQVMMPDSHCFDHSGISNPNFDETSHFISNETPLSEIDRQFQFYKKDPINTTNTAFSSGSLSGVNSFLGNALVSRSNGANKGSIIVNSNQLPAKTNFPKSKLLHRLQEASSDNQSIIIPSIHDRLRNSPRLHSQSYIQLNANDNSYLTVNTSSNDPKKFRKLTLNNYKNYEQQIKSHLDPLISGLEELIVKNSDIVSNDKLSSLNFNNFSQMKMVQGTLNINKNGNNTSNMLKQEEILQPLYINAIQKNSNLKNHKPLFNNEYSNSPSREKRVKSTRSGNEPKLLSNVNSASNFNQNYLQPRLENEKYDNFSKLRPNSILINSNSMIGNNNYLPKEPKNLGNVDLDYINYQERIDKKTNSVKSINPSDYPFIFGEQEIPSLDKNTPIKRTHHSSISDNLGLETFNSFNLNLNLKNIMAENNPHSSNNISQNLLLSDNYRKVEGSQTSRNPIINSGQKNKIIDHKKNFSNDLFNKNIVEITSLHNKLFSQFLSENTGSQKNLQPSIPKSLISYPDRPVQGLNFQNSGAKEIRMELLDPRFRGSLESEFSGLIRLESNKKSEGYPKIINEYNENKYNLPLKIESYNKLPIEVGSETNKNPDELSDKRFEFKVSYMYDLAGHNNSITALVKDNMQNLLWSSSLDHNLIVSYY